MNFWLVVWKLAHSYQISIIFKKFLFPLSCSKNSSAVQVGCLSKSMFCVCISDLCGSLNRHSCTWKKRKKTANIRKMTIRSPMLPIKRVLADHDTRALLPGFQVVLYFDSTFLSWVIYCGYTRPGGCLKSAYMTQTWPGFLIELYDTGRWLVSLSRPASDEAGSWSVAGLN